LNGAHLEGANLNGAHLEGATLDRVHLEKATLNGAHLEGATLNGAYLEGAYLSDAFFDNSTRLHNVILSDEEYGSVSLVDVHWGDANLAVVDWTSVKELGDEHTARQMKTPKGMKKYKAMLIEEYRTAVRANRQLVVVLRNQGLNEEADHFAYYAQVLQKTVFGLQILERRVALRQRIRMFFSWLFSWFLYLLAGYGYRPLRSVTAYLLLILTFAVAFYAFGHLRCYEALVVSLTAFHGRGFFSQEYKPSDPQSIIAAVEAVVGLLIEISFIATFTHRFFGK
ncbi:MAG: pentapeptide repeat-containing protein, partial [Ktedonobacteraceae bacterium]